MKLTEKEYEELKVILIRKDWIVYAYDIKSDKGVYVSTQLGLDMYYSYCHWTEDSEKLEFTEERPIAKQKESARALRHLLEEKVLTRHMNWSTHKEVCSPTPYGHKLFTAWIYWNDTKMQKKMADRKASRKFLKGLWGLVKQTPCAIEKYSQSPEEYKKKKGNRFF